MGPVPPQVSEEEAEVESPQRTLRPEDVFREEVAVSGEVASTTETDTETGGVAFDQDFLKAQNALQMETRKFPTLKNLLKASEAEGAIDNIRGESEDGPIDG